MYNNNDEMFETSDFDEDVQSREALIEEAKNINMDADWNEIMHEITNLKKRWKKISYWESAYEDKLEEEFEGYIEVFYKKRREGYDANKTVKQDLIHQAKALSNSNDWKKTTDGMNDLMNKWKACGTAGKDSDDALWEEFNAARQTFFDRKRKHWEDMKSQFANALTAKEDLIVQAAALSDSEEWQKTSEKFKELMDQWKAAGSAGKEHEDRLWNEFNENRQKFYERRNAHYDKLHEEQNRHYEAKKALVEQAKAVVTAQAFNRSNTELMKKLGVDWKTIGSCGKEKEDKIWNEFRSTMDDYFNGLKEWNQQKHENWRQRMLDIRSRKQDMIQNQNRQIRRMEQEIVGLLGEKAIADMNEAIEDKKEFIKELEAEIADIDKTLAE